MNQPYHVTPDQVSGEFVITRISDSPQEDCCYLWIEAEGLHGRAVVYAYPPEDSAQIKVLELILPARCRFLEDGHLVMIRSEAEEPTLHYCVHCGQFYDVKWLESGWKCLLDRN